MKNLLRELVLWSMRRGAGFECSSSCLGATALTILLSERLWRGWLQMADDSRLLQYAQNGWLFSLGLFVVYGLEARQLKDRLLATGYSKWWTVPLILIIVGLAACPPALGYVRVVLVLAFVVSQFPLFIDKGGRSAERGGDKD